MTELLQLEKLAKKYGFTVSVDADEEENPEYYVTFINDPSSFSKIFGRVTDAQTSMLNFLVSSGSLQPDTDEDELCSLSLLDIVDRYSSAKHSYGVKKYVGGTCIIYNGTRNNFRIPADARNFLVSLVTKHLAEDKAEMSKDNISNVAEAAKHTEACNELIQYAYSTGVHVDIIGSNDAKFNLHWKQDPTRFNKSFTNPVEAITALTEFLGTLRREAPEEQTSYVLNEMQETAKDLHTSDVMNEQTLEKFQDLGQDTKAAWWNGARAALGLPFDTPRNVVSANFLSKPKATLAELLDVLHESVELSSANELKEAVKLIIEVQAMNSGMRDCIRAAYLNGPLEDGDVPSKSGRDSLLTSGYISKVVVKGEQGFNACTYKGSSAYKLIVAGA